MASANISECESPLPLLELLSTNQRLIFAVCYGCVTPAILLFNGALIFALIKTKEYKMKFARYILILTITDFCTGLLVAPIFLYLYIRPGNCFLSWYAVTSAYLFLNLSSLLIFIISLDRYSRMRVTVAECESTGMMKVHTFIIVAICFAVTITIGLAITAVYHVACYFQLVVLSLDFFIGFSTLIFYIKTWWNVHKKSQVRTSEPCKLATSPHFLDVMKRRKLRPVYDKTLTRTISLILTSLCLTYPAYIVVSFSRSMYGALRGKCESNWNVYLVEFDSTFFLLFVNSFANAILYSCNNRKVKSLFLRFLAKNTIGQRRKKSSVI